MKEQLIKLIEFLNKNLDKVTHFLAGWVIVDLISHVFPNYSILALIIAITVAISKEAIDKYIRKTIWDWMDLLVTCLGAVIAFLLILL